MRLHKGIRYGKEYRKLYRGTKAIDPWCRNHGGDKWSEWDRLIQTKRELCKAEAKLEETQYEDEQNNRAWMESMDDDEYARFIAGSLQLFMNVHKTIGTSEGETLEEYIQKVKTWLQAKHK